MSAALLVLVLAQVPYRLADLNPAPEGPSSSNPIEFTDTGGGVAFFWADDGPNGYELWRTDGTDAGTRLVRDLTPGTVDSDTDPIGVLDSGVVVISETFRLYVSDGTATGTARICCHTLRVLRWAMLPPGRVLFAGNPTSAAPVKLYLVDGSAEGASELLDLNVTEFLGVAAGRLFFFARPNPSGASALWATDGTRPGTQQLIAGASSFSRLATTPAGTFTWVLSGGVTTLVRTDGTPGGTVPLGPFNGGSAASGLVAGPTRLFCAGSTTATGNELFSSPGGGGDFSLFQELRPGNLSAVVGTLVPFKSGVLFSAQDSSLTLREPFYADETSGTVTSLGDLAPGTLQCFPDFAPNGSRALLLCTTSGAPQPVWVTDGTDAGTVPLTGPATAAHAQHPTAFGTGWLFSYRPGPTPGEASDPYLTDGTLAGTRRVANLSARGTQPSDPYDFGAAVGLQVPFIGDDGRGYELQLLDVLDGGITLQADLWPGTSGGAWGVLGNLGGRVFIAGETPATGIELFATSGTPGELATPVKDLVGGATGSDPGNDGSGLYRAVAAGGRLYFVAHTPAEGYELFESDGTSAGTHIVRDINPLGDSNPFLITGLPDGGLVFIAEELPFALPTFFRLVGDGGLVPLSADYPTQAARLGDRLLTDMYTAATGWELWITDGTPAGTVPYADVLPGAQGSEPFRLTAQGDRVFFYALDAVDDVGIYRTVDAGTGVRLLRTLQPRSEWSGSKLTPARTGVYFTLTTRDAGDELWFSDGDNVTMLRDIMPGADSSLPDELVEAAGKVFFTAADPEHGRELWVSDGTALGTRLVADVLPGPGSSGPYGLSAALGWLFFGAADGFGSFEPWALPLTENPPSIAAQLTGQTGGDGGWFVSDVGVSFVVTDPLVPILASSGCGTSRLDIDGGFVGTTVVTQDGPDTQLPCSATSSGGTSAVNLSVRRDATAPRVTCPATVVATATSVTATAVTFMTPTAVDQIDPAPQVTLSKASGSTFPLGRTVVTATATDHVGHTSECAFNVEVRDGVAPVLTCPAMESTAVAGTPFDFTASASDDVDPMPMLTYSAMPGTVFPAGRSAVTVTAVDAAGNFGVCVFFVSVEGGADGGGGGEVNGSCGCGASGGLGLVPFVLMLGLRRRREAATGVGREARPGGRRRR